MKIHSDYRNVEGHEEAHGAEMRVVIGQEENAPNFVMRVFELQPGASSPYHTHPWEHEVFVFSGRGSVRNEAGEETPLEPDSVVYVEPNERHSFTNVGDDLLRFVCVIPKLD